MERLLSDNITEQEYKNGKVFSYEDYGFSYDTKKKAFRVTDIQMPRKIVIKKNDRYTSVPPHFHDYIELSYMFSGTCKQTINGKDILLKQGDMSMIDTNTVHSISRTGEQDLMFNIIIRKDVFTHSFLEGLSTGSSLTQFLLNAISNDNNQVNYLVFNTSSSERLKTLLFELAYEYCFPSEVSEEISEVLFKAIVIDMITMIDQKLIIKELNRTNALVVSALAYIDNNYLTCSLEDTAQYVGANAAYLTTLIKKHMGKSCMELIVEKRMHHAADLLLKTSLPVESIITDCGYSNLSYFYKKFKQYFHCHPSEFRKQHNYQ